MIGDFTLLYGNDEKVRVGMNKAIIAFDFDCLGEWSPVTNIPELADGTGVDKKYYIVSEAGSIDLGSGPIEFLKDDRVRYNGTTLVWERTA